MPDVQFVGAAWIPPLERRSVREGVRAMAPVSVAIGVWGVVTGVALVKGGLGVAASLLMTVTVYAGSAQLATLPLLVAGTPWPVVWATAALVNVRFMIFAAASRRSFLGLPFRQRLLAGYLNGDLGFALFSQRYGDTPCAPAPQQHGYFYGIAVMNWAVWEVSSVVGILLGGLAPTDWGLGLAASLALVAVLVPMVRDRPALAGVAVAVGVSLLTARWPMRLGLLVAVLAGVTVAIVLEGPSADESTADRPAPSGSPAGTRS